MLIPGSLLVLLGFIAMGLGWMGAAETAREIEQTPYLISGGLVGLALVVLGGLLLVSTFWVAVLRKLQQEADPRAQARSPTSPTGSPCSRPPAPAHADAGPAEVPYGTRISPAARARRPPLHADDPHAGGGDDEATRAQRQPPRRPDRVARLRVEAGQRLAILVDDPDVHAVVGDRDGCLADGDRRAQGLAGPGSIRLTVSLSLFATHTGPSALPIPIGPSPTAPPRPPRRWRGRPG